MHLGEEVFPSAGDAREAEEEGNVNAFSWQGSVSSVGEHGFNVADCLFLNFPRDSPDCQGVDIGRVDHSFFPHYSGGGDGEEPRAAADLEHCLPWLQPGRLQQPVGISEDGEEGIVVECGDHPESDPGCLKAGMPIFCDCVLHLNKRFLEYNYYSTEP